MVSAAATRDWHKDALAEAGHLGVSDFHMTLGTPTHDAVVGDAAYFVAPATLAFKVRGQPVTQSGATFTVALRRIGDRWVHCRMGLDEAAAAVVA